MKRAFGLHLLSAACALPLGLLCTTDSHADEQVWEQLAQGGKVILMRHAPTNRGRDQGNSLLRDASCKKERNLSAEGQRQARVIGERFRARNIPIAEVRHSPYCRTTDTARLAFGSGAAAEYLSLLEVLAAEDAALQTRQLSRIIGSYTGTGNLVLITHEPNINAVSFEMMKHSDFLVLQPGGGDEFDEIGIVSWSD